MVFTYVASAIAAGGGEPRRDAGELGLCGVAAALANGMRPMTLARMLVAYGSGHEEARALVKEVLDRLQVGPAALFSTLGRTGARGIETVLLARRLRSANAQIRALAR